MEAPLESRPQVLLLTPYLKGMGGVANYYRTLGLNQSADSVDYFFVNDGDQRTGLRLLKRLLQNYYRFWRQLGAGNYKLVVLNPSLNTNSYYRDAAYCFLAALRRKRVVVFFRGWSDEFETCIRNRVIANAVFKVTYQRVKHFIVLGDIFREKLLRLGCSPDSSFWIESTVADDSYLSDFSIKRRLHHAAPLRIVFLSRLVASKGARLAIEAFRIARQTVPSAAIDLTIAGDGPDYNALRSLVSNERDTGIHVIGPVTGESKKDLLLTSDVLLFPTAYGEGMPNVILESMLYGLCILTRDVGAIRDAVQHEENGFVTGESDPAIFAEWIVRLATDTQLRHTMALANHRKALRLYTATAVRNRLKKIFDELLLK
jgi:glycosyltransferase involved in cell wall biosynthesis